MMNSSLKVLRRNSLFYNYFVEKKILKAGRELSGEEVLERIGSLAKFAWRNHPGYYFDGRIENILFDYGSILDTFIDKKSLESDIERLFPEKATTRYCM